MNRIISLLKKPYFLLVVLFTFIILLLTFFIVSQKKDYTALKNELYNLKSSTPAPQTLGVNIEKETIDLVTLVGKLIELPENEKPTIGTLSDLTAIKDQPFFAKAEGGDKLLIYPEAKKTYLYRPSTNKLINVGPVSFSSPKPSASPQPTPTTALSLATPQPEQSFKFTILNGTKKAGLAKNFEAEVLKKLMPSSIVIKKGDAKGDYSKSIIIDVNNSKDNVIEQVSDLFNLERAVLPENETKPETADFLIILGTDKENL